jgi:ubiquinone/menaquinone biosynthesis C-methylase UbiE
VNTLPGDQAPIIDIYRRRAKGYDASGIRSLETWRKEVVKRLNLECGDLVVDMGCGPDSISRWCRKLSAQRAGSLAWT